MNNSNDAGKQRLSQIEAQMVKLSLDMPEVIDGKLYEILRWALSFARISKIKTGQASVVTIDSSLLNFRKDLLALLTDEFDNFNLSKTKQNLNLIKNLLKEEYESILSLFSSNIQQQDLDKAIQKRPFGLTLSGGGGTSYVFLGALEVLEEAKIKPQVITGTSMGAIIGAYRAQTHKYTMDKFAELISSTSWEKIARAYSGTSKYGIPATFRLYIRETLGSEFSVNGTYLKIKDLAIPFRVCVAGISIGSSYPQKDLDMYAHLLDSTQGDPQKITDKSSSVISQILSFTQKPLKALYLGSCPLTKEFDVMDAVGFSSAIPGIFHYDIFRDDKTMAKIINELFEREKIFRLIDGGFVDNLPVVAAKKAVEDGECDGFDPFLLALDSFSPSINKSLLFYPMMKFASENSKEGHALSSLSIKFKNVLSPINFIPTKESFNLAVKYGKTEMLTYLPYLQEILKPLKKPSFLN